MQVTQIFQPFHFILQLVIEYFKNVMFVSNTSWHNLFPLLVLLNFFNNMPMVLSAHMCVYLSTENIDSLIGYVVSLFIVYFVSSTIFIDDTPIVCQANAGKNQVLKELHILLPY